MNEIEYMVYDKKSGKSELIVMEKTPYNLTLAIFSLSAMQLANPYSDFSGSRIHDTQTGRTHNVSNLGGTPCGVKITAPRFMNYFKMFGLAFDYDEFSKMREEFQEIFTYMLGEERFWGKAEA